MVHLIILRLVTNITKKNLQGKILFKMSDILLLEIKFYPWAQLLVVKAS